MELPYLSPHPHPSTEPAFLATSDGQRKRGHPPRSKNGGRYTVNRGPREASPRAREHSRTTGPRNTKKARAIRDPPREVPAGSTSAEMRKSTPRKANCCKTPCHQWFLAKALIARITPDSSAAGVCQNYCHAPGAWTRLRFPDTLGLLRPSNSSNLDGRVARVAHPRCSKKGTVLIPKHLS
jgi:hypothetical protein